MPLTLVTRGPKHGQCNICGDIGPLTEDHTPPKSCVRPTGMTLQHVSSCMSAEPAYVAKANDGVKYRPLCARRFREKYGNPHVRVTGELPDQVRTRYVFPALLDRLRRIMREDQKTVDELRLAGYLDVNSWKYDF